MSLNHYIFIDQRNWFVKKQLVQSLVVFECDAIHRKQANDMFKEETGADPNKLPHIFCEFKLLLGKGGTLESGENIGLTSRNPIIIACPKCFVGADHSYEKPPKSIWCWLCNRKFDYTFRNNRWYQTETQKMTYITRYIDEHRYWDTISRIGSIK